MPMKEMAKAIPDGRPNMIALGIAARLLGLTVEQAFAPLEKRLADKGAGRRRGEPGGIKAGFGAAAGIDSACNWPRPAKFRQTLAAIGQRGDRLGAIRGGIRFAAAYPITPATEMLEWLAPNLTKVGGALLQAEDELASINMIIGASYGGTPALTATSGPGLSLMIEALGLATSAEIPVVVVDVMRGGPSTGIPTKSEQTDLNIAVYGLHGDAPHLVLAPQSIADCLFTTQWATYLAETLQAPAIVLSDQFMGQSRAAIERPADLAFIGARSDRQGNHRAYKRYAMTAAGVSPMAHSGNARRPIHRRRPHAHRAGDADQRRRRPSRPARQAARQARPLQLSATAGRASKATATSPSSPGVRLPAPRAKLSRAPPPTASTCGWWRRACWRRSNRNGLTRRSPASSASSSSSRPTARQFYRYLRAHYDLPAPVRVFNRPGPLPITAGEIHRAIADWRVTMNVEHARLQTGGLQIRRQADLVPGLRRLSRADVVHAAPSRNWACRRNRSAVVSGIGCSSRIPAYTNCYGFHGVHGRSLALAAGLKVTRPDLTVVVASGDGDGYSIGGNHFLHACRRNIDMTYVVMDNHVYGMTKGQPSPTTEPEFDTALSPGGTGVRPFHPLVIALASGANFIARCFSGDPNQTADVLAEAIKHPGFSFVEILSPCVTFRPDEKAWKEQVHAAPVAETADQGKAARRLMTDDGFNLGILYRGSRTPYQPAAGATNVDLSELEKDFEL